MSILAPEVAAERYAHGTRARYVLAHCRCFPCKVANANYAEEQAEKVRKPYRLRRVHGGWWLVRTLDESETLLKTKDRGEAARLCTRLNYAGEGDLDDPLLRTRAVRDHLHWLASEGVGVHQVAHVARVGHGTLCRILGIGGRPVNWCRRTTADRVLAVGLDDVANGAVVDAGPTWDLIGCLLGAGWPKARIARALGSRAEHPALQIRRNSVVGRTARAVRELHDRAWIADTAVRLACTHERVDDPRTVRNREEKRAQRRREAERVLEVL